MASTARLSMCARWCRSTRRRSSGRWRARIVCSRSRRIRGCAAGVPRSCRSWPMRRSTISMARRCGSRRRIFRCRRRTFWRTSRCRRWIASSNGCGGRCNRRMGRAVGWVEVPMYENLLANVPTDLWIGGKWRKASDGKRFDVIDPATENTVASVASATVDDAKAAVDAASAAFPAWAAKKPRERGETLRKAFDLIMRDAERLAKLITLENGKALPDSRGEVAYAAEFFRWNAEEAVRNLGQLYNAPSSGARVVVQHKPAGVAVLVTPWNFPAAMATRKIGPALAAGCTVVL